MLVHLAVRAKEGGDMGQTALGTFGGQWIARRAQMAVGTFGSQRIARRGQMAVGTFIKAFLTISRGFRAF